MTDGIRQTLHLARVACAFVLLGTAAGRAEAALNEIGDEFQISGGPLGQDYPRVAMDGVGNFVAVWGGSDGENGVRFRRYNSAGVAVSGDIVVTEDTSSSRPDIAVDGSGNVIVTWGREEGYNYSCPCPIEKVYTRRFDGSGNPLGPQVLVGGMGQLRDHGPDVAAGGAGQFVVVWHTGSSVYARRYLPDGAPDGDEILVGPGGLRGVAVSMMPSGRFVVAWAHNGIRGRTYDASGAPEGNEVLAGDGTWPGVAFDATGAFVVVWRAAGSVWARRYAAGGAPLTDAVSVFADVWGQEHETRVASEADGDFFVVSSLHGDVDAYIRHMSAGGAPLSEPLRLNEYLTREQYYPDVATTGRRVIAVWNSYAQACSSCGRDVFAQRYSTNGLPLANAGPDQAVDEGAAVTLDGSASSDADGDSLTYSWAQVAGTAVILDLSDPVHPTYTAPSVPVGGETLTFRLIVSDGEAPSEPSFVNVTVKNVNHAPGADAGADQTVAESSPVTLDGSASSDQDNDALTYSWLQTAGTAVTLDLTDPVHPTFTAPLVGTAGETLTFELTVSDGAATAADTVLVQVANVNQPPVADAGPAQTVDEETAVTLDGSASRDPDSEPITFAWTQVGGPAVVLSGADTSTPSFTAPAVGPGGADLTFELVVRDDVAPSARDQVTVHVRNVNDPPRCDLASGGSLWPPNHKLVPVTVRGVSDPNDDDVVILILGVTQDEPLDGLGDGDTSPDAVLQGSTVLVRAERSGLGDGRVYRIDFRAQDSEGGSCTGAVTVGVPHSRGGTPVWSGQSYNSLGE